MPNATEPLLSTELSGATLRLTLNRPRARNALSWNLLLELERALAEAATSDNVKVVVIAAQGPAFCAGHDLKELTAFREEADGGAASHTRVFDLCAQVMQAVVLLPQPVIAEVAGIATAAGCQLVASCDLAYAAPEAKFATPGVNIGLFCSTPAVALTRAVPPRAAAEMLLTGDAIDAQTAQAIGLINRVIPADALTSHVMAVARKIAGKPPAVIRLGKRTVRAQAAMPLTEAYAHASAAMVTNMQWQEAKDGIAGFLGPKI
ncbi:MAG TPA: enoyl-CoA hydratase [Alphaproteobacteria bacterium]|nr:enoyl-CoA hydratase [Alphaproteobacteria bacterium]HAJ47907.1 enoyl-CoA hydratase [Alphaproteobacteria bacterium]